MVNVDGVDLDQHDSAIATRKPVLVKEVTILTMIS